MLVDMHINEWNDKFLVKYDPVRMADLYEQAGLTSAMFYCQSHIGLCYWPTQSGKMHANLHGRDIVAEMLKELAKRNIAACGYYSVIFNNWAFLEYPEWRQHAPWQNVTDRRDLGCFAGSRYGLVCPNNPDYRAFVNTQIDEMVGGYCFEGMFYDMTFWPCMCMCPHCRDRFRGEHHAEFPDKIDWFGTDWCRFQLAREHWMAEFAQTVTDYTKKVHAQHHPQAPAIAVYHNCATLSRSWSMGSSIDSANASDFLGGDFYGDPLDQLVICKLMSNLTNQAPLEFMTSRCVSLQDHERTKSYDEMEMAAKAATLFSGAFLFIDAVNADGTVNTPVYKRVGKIFRDTARYEPYLGGRQIEDIGVYFGNDARVDLAENGLDMRNSDIWKKDYPHMKAIRGICRMLQQHHMPFGVVTRKQLGDLGRYKVLVLPNVVRMTQEEVAAVRKYVAAGGKLYASRYSSLVESRGVRHDDFMLADVFGCHLAADDLGKVTYLKPGNGTVAKLIAPQRYLSHIGMGNCEGASSLRLAPGATGEVLATLTLPYDKEWGGLGDQKWISIHSSPPWQDTDSPVIVLNTFGRGRCIYSSADLEMVESEANDRLMGHLLGLLLDEPLSYGADTHPSVWMNAADQPDSKRIVVGFLNNQSQLPAISLPRVPFTLRPPAGRKFTRLLSAPTLKPVKFTLDADGTLHAAAGRLKVFSMLLAEYE